MVMRVREKRKQAKVIVVTFQPTLKWFVSKRFRA